MPNPSILDDPRVTSRTASINGYTYKYLHAEPSSGTYRATIFLIHGWPDLSLAWRHQIPTLLALNLRIICPDLLGFGSTSAPRVPPNSLSAYSHKTISSHIAELARQLSAPKIILGGHDWGGAVVYSCAQWYPELVSHVFSVCTPYSAPSKERVSLEALVGRLPQFGYQLHLAGPEVEARIKSREDIRRFLNGMYGAKGPQGEVLFEPKRGILFENLEKVGKTSLLSDVEMDYYVDEYSRNGLHGTLNWYRTRETNYREELSLTATQINIPVLFIAATRDNVLLPSMSLGMEKHIPQLTRREVPAGHWALWQTKEAVNGHVREWIEGVVFGGRSKL